MTLMNVLSRMVILIRPGIDVASRYDLERKVDEVARRFGGSVIGGGQMLDGSETDLRLEVADLEGALPHLQVVLQQAGVGEASKIRQFQPVQRTFEVYGARES